MISVAAFRKLALAQAGTAEAPHFDLASFRAGGKIFATLSEKEARAMVKLTPEQQEVLTAAEPEMFQRIPNTWGDKGATWLHLKQADRAAAESALKTAWTNVTAPKSAPKRRIANKDRSR
jgi:hypothetical protein